METQSPPQMADLLKLVMQHEASDLFINPGAPPCLKIHGQLRPVGDVALDAEQARGLAYAVMNERQRTQFENALECNFAIAPHGVGRFRVNVHQQQSQVGMVLRRIESRIPTLDSLQLPKVIEDLTLTKRGLVILAGGTGTGKSTTLAAMVGHRNNHSSGHIITIEDPIEYVHPHRKCLVTQREVGVDTHTFEEALKNTLRQAPDVILIGEIRSRETMEHAIAFAETGHLCMATLHANSSNQALDRIINFFPEDRRDQLLMDLSLNLKSVISQRLLPTPDGKGRRAAVEIMINSPLVSDLILKNDVHMIKDVMSRSREIGMQTFDQALYDLYRQRAIRYEDAIANADSQNELRLMIKLSSDGAAQRLAEQAGDLGMMEDEDPDTMNLPGLR